MSLSPWLIRATALAALLCVPLHADAQVPAVPASDDKALDAFVEAKRKEAGIVGVGAAIIVDGQVVWKQGYGFADRERSKPFTPDTVMGIASITKTFVGVSMMRAVHEGKLALDEDINGYLPFRVVNPHHPGEIITLRQLATFTSSITDRPEVYAQTYHFDGDSREPLGQFLEQYFAVDGKHYSRDNFLDARPGTQRDYSNIGAALAGYIVERAVGEPLNDYTRKHIFEPLGMSSSGWFLSEIDPGMHSRLYVAHNGHVIPIAPYGSTTYPDGGVRTSVADLSKYFIALLNGGEQGGVRILDKARTSEMQRFQFDDAHHPENFPASEGNSGLFWRTKFNGKLVGFGGNDPGVQTEMLADRTGRIGLILFMNTSLAEEGQQASAAIFNALWKRAEKLAEAANSTVEP